jgi:hypothetical protein
MTERRGHRGLGLAPATAVVAVTALIAWLGAGVSGADTKDALIGAAQAFNNVPTNNGAEGVVTCPGNQRALGGGIVHEGSLGDLDLRASGPLDDSGTMAGTRDGDRPVSWYAAASNFTGTPRNFRLFVVCADANVVVETSKFEMPTGEGKQKSVSCRGSRRVVGGGVIQNGTAGGSFVRESGPTDGGGYASTRDGDVAKAWFAAMHNQGGSSYFKVFAVCAKGSHAKLQVTKRKLPAEATERDAQVDCPGQQRALGGGLLHSRGLDGYYALTPSGPLDGSGVTANTGAGDKPKIWYAGIENVFGSPKATFKVAAICE